MGTSLDIYFRLARHEDGFHPKAIEQYNRFISELDEVVYLNKLAKDDIVKYLSEREYKEWEDGLKTLSDWLENCRLVDSNYTESLIPFVFPYTGVYEIKPLLLRIAGRKESEKRYEAHLREERARAQQAETESKSFLANLDKEKTRLRQTLVKQKKPQFSYPESLAPYSLETWCELTLPTTDEIDQWATPHIQKVIPPLLRQLVSWNTSYQVLRMPYLKYEQLGVPCLTWYFKLLVLATLKLRLRDAQLEKEFAGLLRNIKLSDEELGILYIGPVEWESCEGFSTPLALLRLLSGNTPESPGIEVLIRDEKTTVYTVDGYDENYTELNRNFTSFIKAITKDQSLVQALLAQDMIDEYMAELVSAKWAEPLPVTVTVTTGGGPDLGAVTAKLTEMGWTEDNAKTAVEAAIYQQHASTQEIVETILEKSNTYPM